MRLLQLTNWTCLGQINQDVHLGTEGKQIENYRIKEDSSHMRRNNLPRTDIGKTNRKSIAEITQTLYWRLQHKRRKKRMKWPHSQLGPGNTVVH